jgi:hypothetical protein
MTRSSTHIERTFYDLSEKDAATIGDSSFLAGRQSLHGPHWDDLLTARRVLIVSEAGVGKTYECRACQQRLWSQGEPAFFLELSTLADTDVRDMLGQDERIRFDGWLQGQSEIATFFLDSIDELKVSQKSFEQALKRLGRATAGRLNRARIVITTRPIPFDRTLIERILPIPPTDSPQATADDFVDAAMRTERPKIAETHPIIRNVGLLPLTNSQIKDFAVGEGVIDPDQLLSDIERRHAEEYAQRPQDLIELCSDWKEHHRIRRHAEQVAANADNRLKARTDRPEKTLLSDARAFEGASRLALAAMLTRKLTIRYNAESDEIHVADAALDASKVLTDWSQPERDTLLERAMFGFANYGRVRFHHRSAIEFLAAKRVDLLLARKRMTVRAVKRLLFTTTSQGEDIVRPSVRPIAGWLSLWRDEIYSEVLRREPALLLIHGDPQSLSPTQRATVLTAHVRQFGKGGWRGLEVPTVQVKRFATKELDDTVRQLWATGVENPEIRSLLFELVGLGNLRGCADIAFHTSMDDSLSHRDRIDALDALIALDDGRLKKIGELVSKNAGAWPDGVGLTASMRLFPKRMSVSQLCSSLKRVMEPKGTIGEITWKLPQVIESDELASDALDELRARLTNLILDEVEWQDNSYPHAKTKRRDLTPALITACNRQFAANVRTPELLRSSVTALRFTKADDYDDAASKTLRRHLAEASPKEREHAFWIDQAFLEKLRPAHDAWHRVYLISHLGGIQLNSLKDRDWVIRALADPEKTALEREMMLWAAIIECPQAAQSAVQQLQELKAYVQDAPDLLKIVEERLKPQATTPELRRLEEQSRKQKAAHDSRQVKARASWKRFWKQIAENPDQAFSDPKADNTAWNLWQAMERSGSNSRETGWNRRFIQEQFGQAVADRLRSTLMKMWRKDTPTLRSERPDDKKNTFLVRWQLGVTAIYAEAEDPQWAEKLTEQQAELAARFAPMQLNGFPPWLEQLVSVYPKAVDRILGNELTLALREAGADTSATMFLQNIRHASPKVAEIFLPRIKSWLDDVTRINDISGGDPILPRVSAATELLLHSADSALLDELERIAIRSVSNLESPAAKVWLPVLMQVSPEKGVKALEDGLAAISPSPDGLAVNWFSLLFDRDHRGTEVDIRRKGFPPRLLLRLARLAFKHVRLVDDARHEGAYSLGERDYAEQGRSAILNALFATTGSDGWAAKLKLAEDPLFRHIRDRVMAIARERAAEEVDNIVLTEANIVALDTTGEPPSLTRDDMFAVMCDRLDDIEDLLLQDVSPRELWSGAGDERVMRRELARQLRNSANHMYTVDQESATADEKETDIRMRSASSNQQAVIELKIGEKPRSAKELQNTIKQQLVKKYMAAEECRAGCLVVTIASNKTWSRPNTRKRLDFHALIKLLSKEAERVALHLGGNVRLAVRGLDLRPRLLTERAAKIVAKSKERKTKRPVTKKRRAPTVHTSKPKNKRTLFAARKPSTQKLKGQSKSRKTTRRSQRRAKE